MEDNIQKIQDLYKDEEHKIESKKKELKKKLF